MKAGKAVAGLGEETADDAEVIVETTEVEETELVTGLVSTLG